METRKEKQITIFFGAKSNSDLFLCTGLEVVAEVHSNLGVPDFD